MEGELTVKPVAANAINCESDTARMKIRETGHGITIVPETGMYVYWNDDVKAIHITDVPLGEALTKGGSSGKYQLIHKP